MCLGTALFFQACADLAEIQGRPEGDDGAREA